MTARWKPITTRFASVGARSNGTYPLLILSFKLPSALLAGNTLWVVKPAPTTPLATCASQKIKDIACEERYPTSSPTPTISAAR